MARVAVVVQENHPRTEAPHTVVGLVNRPYWSNEGANEWSLIGGKVNDDDVERARIPLSEKSLTEQGIEAVTRQTAQREVLEEIGVEVSLEQLMFVGLFQNGEWVSALFYVLLDERPTITIGESKDPLDQVDGFVWMGANRSAVGGKIFADHQVMVAEAISDALSVPAENGSH